MRPNVRPALFAALLAALAILVAVPFVHGPASPQGPASPTVLGSGAAPAGRPTATVEGMRIRIARLGIDLPLHEGDVQRDIPTDGSPGSTPEGAAFHLPGTGVPGSAGNCYIYAHARAGMFLSLWQARVGDRVEIVRPDGSVLAYGVIEVHPQVPSSDVTWVRPTEDERLTLQTSTGPTPDNPRFIVIARREGPT